MNPTLFQVTGLSKRFGTISALSDVAFHVRAGEVLGLIGPNGAGKSTLFECLAGVLPSDSGTMLVDGRPVVGSKLHTLLFYVPDGIAPWPLQSLQWALDFTIGFLGGQPSLRDEVIEQLDLGPLLHQPIGTLSKGQRKRALLGIGRSSFRFIKSATQGASATGSCCLAGAACAAKERFRNSRLWPWRVREQSPIRI
jgi:ABC-2 type transport system ATP-binding protein